MAESKSRHQIRRENISVQSLLRQKPGGNLRNYYLTCLWSLPNEEFNAKTQRRREENFFKFGTAKLKKGLFSFCFPSRFCAFALKLRFKFITPSIHKITSGYLTKLVKFIYLQLLLNSEGELPVTFLK